MSDDASCEKSGDSEVFSGRGPTRTILSTTTSVRKILVPSALSQLLVFKYPSMKMGFPFVTFWEINSASFPHATRLWNSARLCLVPFVSFQTLFVARPKVATLCPFCVLLSCGSRVTLPSRITLLTDFMREEKWNERDYAASC